MSHFPEKQNARPSKTLAHSVSPRPVRREQDALSFPMSVVRSLAQRQEIEVRFQIGRLSVFICLDYKRLSFQKAASQADRFGSGAALHHQAAAGQKPSLQLPRTLSRSGRSSQRTFRHSILRMRPRVVFP